MAVNLKKRAILEACAKQYDPIIRKHAARATGSLNKATHVKYMAEEFDGLSKLKALKKLKEMGLKVSERKKVIENNSEFSRVFGVKKDPGERKLTRREQIKQKRLEEQRKQLNISEGRKMSKEEIQAQHKADRKNRLSAAYSKEQGTAEEYGYAHVGGDHHGVSAKAGGGKSQVPSTKNQAPRGVAGQSPRGLTNQGSKASSLTGGMSGAMPGSRNHL
ncbi:hypothetical protein C0584_05145 [Candidatus Parcubacteria bacterium]|nr:MAG: hypothetical protein C0584_05145 [Candidatus Parcubacteria bacterium]